MCECANVNAIFSLMNFKTKISSVVNVPEILLINSIIATVLFVNGWRIG